MKGMILAAGLGTRMGPISRYLAKPAVPFLGVPMVEHSVAVLRSGGIREIIINLHHMPQTVKDVLGDGSRLGVRIDYSLEDPVLGTGGGIGKARDFFEGKTFAVLNSDILIDIDLKDVIETHNSTGAVATLALRPDSSGKYGNVFTDKENRIRQIEGHPEDPANEEWARYMFAGLHVLEPRWFDYTPKADVYDSIRNVYAPMIQAGEKVLGHIFQGRWIDLGSARRLLQATVNSLVGNLIPHPQNVGKGSVLRQAVLSPRARIGEGCRLERVLMLGDSVVGNGSHLSNCIVCPGSLVHEKSDFNNSVIANGEPTSLDDIPD